ncbi:MAG TPA: MG2 domain-containing protein, partial [Deltaproteobacteria bacterium]|nr:MG2 domain-containing protein [Deltaproteobacteria bacterium]
AGVATGQDQVLSFKVRDAFSASCGCERERPDGPCIPVLPIQLPFTAPISKTDAGRIVLRHKDGRVWKARPVDYGSQGGKETRRVIFDGPFPEKAAFSIMLPPGLRDDTGRTLINQSRFPLTVKTGGYPVLAKFSSRFGILEKADGVLPVTVRNIEMQAQKTPAPAAAGAKKAGQTLGKEMHLRLYSIEADKEALMINWLRTVAKAKRDTSLLKGKALVREIPLPRRGRTSDFEVVGIPLPGPGLHLVEMESRLLGNSLLQKPAPMFVPSLALVTNLAVHFKEGQENALVWVTALDSGQPVRDAAVTIRDAYGTLLWQGRSDARGVALVDRRLSARELPYEHCMTDEYAPGLENLCQGFFVFARLSDDMTFTHSSWSDGIEPWRFNLPESDTAEDANIVAHTILDRSLLRAGETVHMKHIIRTQTSTGFGLPRDARLPQTAVLMHLGSDQEYRVPITWQKGGAGECDWKIPEAAKLGTYHIYLQTAAPDAKPEDFQARYFTGKLRVEEFRVPLMKAVIQPPKGEHIRPQAMDIDLSVAYLSGGGASGLPVKLRAEVRQTSPVYRGYEGFSFTGGALKPGIVGSSLSMDRGGFDEGPEAGSGDDRDLGAKPVRLPTQDLTCDANGAVRARLTGIPRIDRPGVIHAELEFRDAGGEAQTAAVNIPIHPSRRVVGIKTDSSFVSSGIMKYSVAVLDISGQPVKGAAVTIDLFQRTLHSHRVRLVGGFYAYQNTLEIKALGTRITGTTDARGLLFCSTKAPVSGEIVIQAAVKDEAGNTAHANAEMWVSGRDALWFEQGNDDRIDVIPMRHQYEPGETARFQVRMPFGKATALVSVEREGVMDIFVRSLSGVNPIVEVPIKNNHAPNVFVSVLAVRGRIGGSRPTATFDPGKPAYKLGIAEIKVGWKGHRLDVEVAPDKPTYRTRETMQVRFKVRKAEDGRAPSAGQIAVAAVDEGLLELMPNESWRLLDAMMRRRGYGVRTSTAQGLVVGKRHFGLKALPHGGGGGKQMTRELFDTLLFWKATVPLDARGEAKVEIPLNDSLTGFRIVAVATGGDGLFGTGEASVRATQDLMLLSSLPQLVREGDRFMAGATLRNASGRGMDIEALLAVDPTPARQRFKPIRVSVPAGEARPIAWPLIVPYGADRLTYTMTAGEIGGRARDRLRVTQKV